MALFRPERYLTSFVKLDFGWLLENGYNAVFLDVDNTLLPRTQDTVPAEIREKIEMGKAMGIRFCLVSNSWHQRSFDVAGVLGLPLVGRALKPLPFGFWRARCKIGAKRHEIVVVGDQLYTDVLGAHLAGMKAVLVEPLVQQDLRHTMFLRKVAIRHLHGMEPES